jgi:hypothetical protein
MAQPTPIEKFEDAGRQMLFLSATISAITTLLCLFMAFSGGFNPHSLGGLFMIVVFLATAVVDSVTGAIGLAVSTILLCRFKTFSIPGFLAAIIAVVFWVFITRLASYLGL